jgi:hypothetical protein
VAETFGNVISISTKGQASIAQSSGEAELGALHRCALKMIGIQNFVQEVWNTSNPITLCTDSSAAKVMSLRRGCGKVRHLEVKQLYIQELTTSSRIRIEKVERKKNKADCGTKPHSAAEYEKFRNMLQVVSDDVKEVKEEVHSPSDLVATGNKQALVAAIIAALVDPSTATNTTDSDQSTTSWTWLYACAITVILCIMTFLFQIWIGTRSGLQQPLLESEEVEYVRNADGRFVGYYEDYEGAQLDADSQSSGEDKVTGGEVASSESGQDRVTGRAAASSSQDMREWAELTAEERIAITRRERREERTWMRSHGREWNDYMGMDEDENTFR